MKKYFNGAISQRELATIVRGALGAQLALHNTFIRALYTTAEAAAFVEELGPDWRTKIPKEKPLPLRPTNVPQQQPVRRSNQGFSTQRPPVAHPGGGQQRAPAQPKILWRVKYPALGTGATSPPSDVSRQLLSAALKRPCVFAGLSVRGSGAGPPQVQSSLTGGITDLLLDEQSFVAMHNRMLQLCLPTAVDAVSPDAVVLLLHALGVRAALPPSHPRCRWYNRAQLMCGSCQLARRRTSRRRSTAAPRAPRRVAADGRWTARWRRRRSGDSRRTTPVPSQSLSRSRPNPSSMIVRLTSPLAVLLMLLRSV